VGRGVEKHLLTYDPTNVFARILRGEIPAEVLYEDEHCMAFLDVTPQAPTHFLVIPKREIATLSDATQEDEGLLGHLLVTAANVAKQLGVDQDGSRIVINNGAGAGQTVFHLHVHVLAGRSLAWPPG
jgi:histidine triad (HIT) family protein